MVRVKSSMPTKNLNKRKRVLNNKRKNKIQPGRARRGRRGIHKKREPRGVVYLSHIPHGFYDEQIEAYFSQFGKVTAVSVPRSKSGKAKGFSFIEYKYAEIAKIAAETMNNYLMCNRLLKAKYIPPEEQKPHLFRLAKLARENLQTLAEKGELALKHHRRVKNRHLKLGLEAKVAAKLIKKKMSLIKRVENLGLSPELTVEEANVQSIFERRKEIEAQKSSKSNKQDLEEESEGTDTSEERISSSERGDDTVSLDSDDSPDTSEERISSSERGDDTASLDSDDSLPEAYEDFLSESDENEEDEEEEEDYKKIISKARKAAKDILKKTPKPKIFQKPNKGLVSRNASLELISLQKKKTVVGNENMPPNGMPEPSNLDSNVKKLNTPLKVKTPKRGVKVDDINKNITPKGFRERNSLNKSVLSVTEKTPLSVKKNMASVQTPTNKKSNVSQVVMEIDNNDEEISFKTPPNVVKRLIDTGKNSAKKTPKGTSTIQSLLTPKTLNSSSKKKPKEGVKSPKEITYPSNKRSPTGKKLRHRNNK